MAKKKPIENQVETWREVSLILLLLLGIVGALSYTLLFRQKDRLLLQEIRITSLTDQVNKLSDELGELQEK